MSTLQLADAKTYLGITGATFDTLLQSVIDSAEAAISASCGPLVPTSRTVRLRPNGGTLLLPSPAISVTAATGDDGSSVTVADLHVAPSGVVTYNDGTAFSAAWYDVTFSYGRAACPPDLLMAVKELVRHLWDTQRGPTRRPGSTVSDATSNTIPGAAYMMPFRVAELIAPHMQPGFA